LLRLRKLRVSSRDADRKQDCYEAFDGELSQAWVLMFALNRRAETKFL
jgi:hypothetical protein